MKNQRRRTKSSDSPWLSGFHQDPTQFASFSFSRPQTEDVQTVIAFTVNPLKPLAVTWVYAGTVSSQSYIWDQQKSYLPSMENKADPLPVFHNIDSS
jgi:hypothetical protein